MRKGKVLFKNKLAGWVIDYDDHFEFRYDDEYLKDGTAISVTFPLQKEPFISKELHSFFDGLIVEGWLLQTVEHNWKIDEHDRMSLLLLTGKDTIGAVSVVEDTTNG